MTETETLLVEKFKQLSLLHEVQFDALSKLLDGLSMRLGDLSDQCETLTSRLDALTAPSRD